MRRYGWVFFVSRRYLGSARRSRRRAASLLSILGIGAGVTTLVTVLSVMNGFQLGTIEDILEVESYHLRVSTEESGTWAEPQASDHLLGLPGVGAVVPFTDTEGLVRGHFSSFDAALLRALPVDVRSIDPGFADAVEMVAGRFSLEGPRSVVVGSEMARALGVGVGEEIRFVALSGASLESMEPEESVLRVQGVFRTGHLDYDRRWIFISQESLDRLLPAGGPSTIGVKLEDRFQDRQGAAAARETLRNAGLEAVTIESWREYNRAIFGALRVEKLFMTGLVGLVFVVVAFNIYQSQRRSIVERYEDIAILKAMGAGPRTLRSVFALEGFMLGFVGSVSGLILGLLLSFNVNEVFALAEAIVNATLSFGDFAIFSPAYFYISEIPTVLPFGEAFGVVLFALGSATAAAFFASKRVGTLRPASVLRYE
jgi:lipoprotein-releasing system permease protein